MKNIPYVLSEKQVRKFEPLIARAIGKYPGVLGPIDTTTSGFLPNVFAARLRDAILSFKRYKWPSELIRPADMEVLLQLKVSETNNVIRVGTKESLKELEMQPPPITPVMEKTDGVEMTPLDIAKGLSSIETICYLSSWRVLTQPIPVIGLTDADITRLETDYDVLITKQTNGTFLIE